MSAYTHFAGMTWPLPGPRLDDLVRKIRVDRYTPTESELLVLASIADAYGVLVECSARKRATVVAGVREGMEKAR